MPRTAKWCIATCTSIAWTNRDKFVNARAVVRRRHHRRRAGGIYHGHPVVAAETGHSRANRGEVFYFSAQGWGSNRGSERLFSRAHHRAHPVPERSAFGEAGHALLVCERTHDNAGGM